MRVDYLTEAQKKAYILADNRMALDAGWDEELLRIEIESLQGADFDTDKANQKWCRDFTYLFLGNGDVRYNCSIIDLYNRSVIASITDRHMTSGLAIRTLQKALDSQPKRN